MKKILIIEDNPKHILSAEKFAKECGYEVVIVNNAADASCELGIKMNDGEVLPFEYDYVLTNLFLPIGRNGGRGQTVPEDTKDQYGFVLALMAMQKNAKGILVMIDREHCQENLTYSFESLFEEQTRIGNTKFMTLRESFEYEHSWYHYHETIKKHLYVPQGDNLEGSKSWIDLFEIISK